MAQVLNDKWELNQQIGQGATGRVFQARNHTKAMDMAVKQLSTFDIRENERAAMYQEIDLMAKVKHKCIIDFYGITEEKHRINLFLEFSKKGSLEKKLRKGKIEEKLASKYTKQLLKAVRYLHKRGIAHRDIKSANILLFDNDRLKITDLGSSKHIGHSSYVPGIKGTPHWMAPEVIKEEQTPKGWCKADVWSIGCTVYEMVVGVAPFWNQYKNPMAAMYHVASNNSQPEFPATLSADVLDFLTSCFERDPTARPSVSKLLRHPFVLQDSLKLNLKPVRTNKKKLKGSLSARLQVLNDGTTLKPAAHYSQPRSRVRSAPAERRPSFCRLPQI